MVQKRETKTMNKLCVREILSLSFVCGAYFFEFRGRNLVCFVIAYNFNGKYAPEAGKTRMRTAFFTRADLLSEQQRFYHGLYTSINKNVDATAKIESFLRNLNIPKLSEEHKALM